MSIINQATDAYNKYPRIIYVAFVLGMFVGGALTYWAVT